jgi:hypothetical protein
MKDGSVVNFEARYTDGRVLPAVTSVTLTIDGEEQQEEGKARIDTIRSVFRPIAGRPGEYMVPVDNG